MNTGETQRVGPSSRGALAVTAAALMTSFLASACCLVPLALVAVGMTSAGVSAVFTPLRPYFLGATGLLLAGAYYFTFFRKPACGPDGTCETPNPSLVRFNRITLVLSTIGAGAFALFPLYGASLVGGPAMSEISAASIASSTASTEERPSFMFRVDGMTCEACSAGLEKYLGSIPGVRSATANYDEASATVWLDPTAPATSETLIEAIAKVGYEASIDSGRAKKD